MSTASNDTSEATTTVTNTLTFTPSNWDTPQTVTVTGADDDIIDGTVHHQSVISIIDANSDDDFDAIADQTVSVERPMMTLQGSLLKKLMLQQLLPSLEPPTYSQSFLMLNQHQMLFSRSHLMTPVKQPFQ